MSGLFTNFVTDYTGAQTIDLVNDTIMVAPVSSGYTFDPSDVYYSDIGVSILSPSVEIGGSRYVSSDDVFDTTEDSFDLNGITGTINAFILYKNTGLASTSELISYHSDDFKGLTKTLTESDLTFIKNTSGFFQVVPEDVFQGRVASYVYTRVAYPHQRDFRS